MGRHLHVASACLAHRGLVARRIGDQQAAIAVIIAVFLQHGRTPAAQRTVDVQLHSTHFQTSAGVAVESVGAQIRQRVSVTVGIGVHPQREAALIGEALEQGQILARHAHVVHASQAMPHRRIERLGGRLLAGRVIGGRNHRVHQSHRAIDEYAVRLAAGALDAAAIRLPIPFQRPGGFRRHRAQCRRIRPAGMPVHAFQPNRAIRERGIQIRGGREPLLGPVVLIPATAQQPGVLRQLRRVGAQAFHDFLLAAGTGQVRAHEREAQPHQVAMRIDESRNHRLAGGLDALGLWILRAHFRRITQRQQPPRRIPGHGLDLRPPRIGGMDAIGGQHGDLRRQSRSGHRTQHHRQQASAHSPLPCV